MHIIIDGYNLIRQSDRLRHAERAGLEAGRNRLIEELIRYNRMNPHRITVVFDGWLDGSPNEEHYRKGGIEIVYSRKGEEADEVIKRMTRRTGGDTLVVTSDRDIADTVVRGGGVVLSSPQFEEKIKGAITGQAIEKEFPDDEPLERVVTPRKKGPSRKLSKRERKARRALKKL